MTVKEVLENDVKKLNNISVPTVLLQGVILPIQEVATDIRACIDALEREEQERIKPEETEESVVEKHDE